MEAHERLELLARPAPDRILDPAIEIVRGYIAEGRLDGVDADEFEYAAAELKKHGTMTSMINRGWELLRERVADDTVSEMLADLEDRVARGASSGSEISAATFGFDDGSYLILVDHGLASLTWLAAQLAVLTSRDTDQRLGSQAPVEPAVAARTLRLGVARSAIQVDGGSVPSLILPGDAAALASHLVAQIDMFVMGHEVAHILLGHVDRGGQSFGAVGGSNHLVGKDEELERAADLLAITLVLDDAIKGAELDRRDLVTRLAAVHLFLAVLELFESHTFVLQPTTHPPANARWTHLVDAALAEWLADDLESLLQLSSPLVSALTALRSDDDIENDAALVEEALGDVLDTKMWRSEHWVDMAKLNAALNMPGPAAIANLLSWPGWDSDEPADELTELVQNVLESDGVVAAVRAALAGEEPLTRLGLLQVIEPASEALRPPDVHDEEPFPSWALATLCGDLIGQSRSRY